ncbi:MAG: aminopeptidase YwaD [Planctomycetota bacterium]|jgi:aminopeptidase YwaD
MNAPSLLPWLLLGGLVACASGPDYQDGRDYGGQSRAQHNGPMVSVGQEGPRRFVPALLEAFGQQHAFEVCAQIDGHYREPGNVGYEAALDLVERELRAAGFGRMPGWTVRMLETPMRGPAWTPLGGSLVLHTESGTQQSLHSFEQPGDMDRCMLPTHAPSGDVRGPIALELEAVRPGDVFVTDQSLRRVLKAALKRGAAAVLSCRLQEICVDPTGEERHLDAIAYGAVGRGTTVPVGFISPRSLSAIRDAGAGAQLHYTAKVHWEERPLRTLVAEIEGVQYPDELVTIVAHVDEPGACDNATGVAGLAEVACAMARASEQGAFLRPRRSLALVWGEEFGGTRAFLAQSKRRPIAGFSSDMTGSSEARTGAICLLERSPDPGAVTPLPPDEHTSWGAGEVLAEDLRPNGLNVIVRAAMVDVGLVHGEWTTAEHPWEGGSDHDIFLNIGVPGVLLWHFTDFAYHTSLDRMDHVDAEELLRTSVALGAAGLAVADARPGDLKRYLDCLVLERRLRLNMVAEEDAGDELAALWENWFTGSRHWLRRLCLGMGEDADVLGQSSAGAGTQDD